MARRGENIYKRKDGRWEGRNKSGYKENGQTKYRSVYGHSYAEVRQKLAPLKVSLSAAHNTCRLTVKELFDEWLSAVKLRVKPSTYANYLLKIEKHILPAFGGRRYDMLTVQTLNRFIDDKLSSGLSPKYVSDIIIVFKSMAKYSSKIHGFRNILADVTLPKIHRKELSLLSPTQQRKLSDYLLRNLNSTSLCVLLSLYTGLRVGEVCGLMWSDIDFDKRILHVRRTVQRIRSGVQGTQLIADTPKSRSSRRSIPIPTFIMKEDRFKAGTFASSGGVTQGFETSVFDNVSGIPLRVYDSKGLEVKDFTIIKKDLINYLKEQCGNSDPMKWIHSIFYCVNVKGGRLEKPEIDFINDICGSISQTIHIVLTNCDAPDASQVIEMEKYIRSILKNPKTKIIKVNSVETNSRIGKYKQFGREEALKTILNVLWSDICTKVSNNYTQQYIYEKLDISQNHYSRIENGHAGMSFEILLQLSEILELSTDYILMGTPAPTDNIELLNNYKLLNPKQRKYIDDHMKLFINSNLK